MAYDFWQQSRLDEQRKIVGSERIANEFERVFQRNLSDAPKIAMHPSSLASLLEQGRYRTLHETGTGIGVWDDMSRETKLRQRGVAEQRMGIGPDDPKPIYGYAGKFDEANVDVYGSARVKLKPSVKDRTTVSFGDSLADAYPMPWKEIEAGTALPEKYLMATARNEMPGIVGGIQRQLGDIQLTQVQKETEALLPEYIRERSRAIAPGSYMEAQIHGGVSLGDIESVKFTQALSEESSARILPLLEQHGISYELPEVAPPPIKSALLPKIEPSKVSAKLAIEAEALGPSLEALESVIVDHGPGPAKMAGSMMSKKIHSTARHGLGIRSSAPRKFLKMANKFWHH